MGEISKGVPNILKLVKKYTKKSIRQYENICSRVGFSFWLKTRDVTPVFYRSTLYNSLDFVDTGGEKLKERKKTLGLNV
jgi:hypothetical protein